MNNIHRPPPKKKKTATSSYFAFLVAQIVNNPPANWDYHLELEMETYFSILAWEIPWIEKSGRLQSIGCQRVGHDSTHTNM